MHEIFFEFLKPFRFFRIQRVACELDTGAGWESIPLRSSRARVSLSLDTVVVGEVKELEEDVG